jgi:hypothetical protein
MEKITTSDNSLFIARELDWLSTVIVNRMKLHFKQPATYASTEEIPPPSMDDASGVYVDFIKEYQLELPDRICLILSLVPLLKPQLFDHFGLKNSDTGQRFVEFGCMQENISPALVPTIETLLFLLAGDQVAKRLAYVRHWEQHPLFTKKMLLRERKSETENFFTKPLLPSPQLISRLLKEEKEYLPEFSTRFPAHRLTTSMEWDDLVLAPDVMRQLDEIRMWVKYGPRILGEWGMNRKMKAGYKALFYGPPGTGKTLTASLLGKYTGKEVYGIDLSMVVSKYIGETEKNLSHIFDVAENKEWILFFDEGDALFGKRTQVKDAHDRYANQEVSYLLQRLEDYRGLVVLSTNLRTNIDEAFTRRFQSIIRFSMPDSELREQLWRNTFPSVTEFAGEIDLEKIARRYELPGGSILNVVRYCLLMAIQRDSTRIECEDIEEGIRKELRKEGKMI